jgi:glycosyltransferase involved in cell wall biosynthesis
MAPKVSICIPTYNQLDYLKICLQYIADQTFDDYEIIITDDSSDNQIEEYVNALTYKNKINYKKNSIALGSPKNWNYALQLATGDLIKIIHHDDFFAEPTALKEFVEVFDAKPTVGFVFCSTKIKMVDSGEIKLHQIKANQLTTIYQEPELLFYNNLIGAPSVVMMRKQNLALFDENLKWLVDVDWYYKCIRKCKQIDVIRKPLVGTHHGFDGQTTQQVQNQKDIQVREHVIMFDNIRGSIKRLKQFNNCFEILFSKYAINSLEELKAIVSYDKANESYYLERIQNKNSFLFFKKMSFWINKDGAKAIVDVFKSKLK